MLWILNQRTPSSLISLICLKTTHTIGHLPPSPSLKCYLSQGKRLRNITPHLVTRLCLSLSKENPLILYQLISILRVYSSPLKSSTVPLNYLHPVSHSPMKRVFKRGMVVHACNFGTRRLRPACTK